MKIQKNIPVKYFRLIAESGEAKSQEKTTSKVVKTSSREDMSKLQGRKQSTKALVH